MKITDVRVRKLSEEGKMKGIVSVTFDEAFVVHDIKIIEGQTGLFIAMPSRKVGEGDYRDIAHPINSEMRTTLQESILKAYEEMKQKMDQLELEEAPVFESEEESEALTEEEISNEDA